MSRRVFHVCIQITALHVLGTFALHIPSNGPSPQPQHVCRLEKGFEPNFEDSDECGSYWRCEDYVGTLQHCRGSDQFHFQYGVCMNDDDVSCWVQMEKHYHGFSYDHHSQSAYSMAKTCEDGSRGQEPNYYDEGCKSYWYCEDNHQGSLHECPTGFQFDWSKLDCLWDREVFCEKQVESFYERVLYNMIHSAESGHSHADDAFNITAHSGRQGATPKPDPLNSQPPPSPPPPPRQQQQQGQSRPHNPQHPPHPRHQRCDVDTGREPDVTSGTCQTFWKCIGHRGTRERCPTGYLFHWDERECLKDVYVDCPGQALRQRLRQRLMLRGTGTGMGMGMGGGKSSSSTPEPKIVGRIP